MLAANNANASPWSALAKLVNAPILVVLSIVIGSVLGYNSVLSQDWISASTDNIIFVLVTLLFFNVRFDKVLKSKEHIRFLAIAVAANFLFVPIIGYCIATLVLQEYQLFMIGLMIYFMSPCTDWFLAFTRIAHGNTLFGSTLLPINMIIQLILYPVFLYLFTQNTVAVQQDLMVSTLVVWFIQPFLIALALRLGMTWLLNDALFEKIADLSNQLIPFVIALLVVLIFAGNINVLFEHRDMFVWMLLAVFSFFVVTFLLSEVLSKVFKLKHPEHALLTITIAARNAPLMLAITMVALPNQPVIYAAIVVGMLLEFPHLAILTYLLKRKYIKQQSQDVAETQTA